MTENLTAPNTATESTKELGRTEQYLAAAKEYEPKWVKHWVETNPFKTPSPTDKDFDATKPKKVILDFFPYPSGAGLHLGHPLGYTATDIISRACRMQGYNVLHSMGFDSFGLPAEQYAIQTGRQPKETTEENIRVFTRELRALGYDHDETARFSSCEPDYYRWTQWLFLQLFNSYYDKTLEWTDALGHKIKGRARPIAELKERLASGAWKKNTYGEIAPADDKYNIPVLEGELEATVDANRIAVIKNVDVNWCPMLGTVLANEEVTPEGKSERGDYPVYKKPLKQWVLRITEYADRLYDDLGLIDWSKGVIEMQKEWIGPSTGALVTFTTEEGENLNVYTTRPDTLPGVTFVAVAPEHPLAVKYAGEAAKKMISLARNHAYDDKSAHNGVFTGQYVLHPLTGRKVPVWVGDYVLSGYGEGAVMGVPSHDTRDFEFAHKFDIPIEPVLEPTADWLKQNAPKGQESASDSELLALYLKDCGSFATAFTDDNTIIKGLKGFEDLGGISNREAIIKICHKLEVAGKGKAKKTYRIRDWLFSRQRYWGEPFPIVFDKAGKPYAVTEDSLPILLPFVTDFKPTTSEDKDADPVTPLGRVTDWVKVKGTITPDGKVKLAPADSDEQGLQDFTRDTNTMPNWAGSCWYYLRYFSPAENGAFVNSAAEKYWAGANAKASGAVDLYVGGAEHAVLHLLYARFWHKVFYDLGLVSTPEPFYKLFNQGMITADAYSDSRGFYVDVHDVEDKDENGTRTAYNKLTGEKLTINPGKMGKRYKNGVSPEEVCARHSTDAFRCHMMFMGPLEATSPWRESNIIGQERFLAGVWYLAHRGDIDTDTSASAPASKDIERLVHKTIKEVTDAIANIRLNTGLSSLMILTNALISEANPKAEHIDILLRLLAPYAPFMIEQIYAEGAAGKGIFSLPEGVKSAGFLPWPLFDEAKLVADEVLVVVQINGKKRAEFMLPASATDADIEAAALKDESVQRHLEGKSVKRMIHIPQKTFKMLGIVVG